MNISFRIIWSFSVESWKRGYANFMQTLQKRNYEDKLKLHKEIEAIQHEMINMQLNTHFTLKTGDSVSEKILNSERFEAYDLVNSFSNLMRSGVLFSNRISWSLKEELAFTKNYLDLMKIQYIRFFDFNMLIEKSDEYNKMLVPRLFVQNCTENLIKNSFAREKTKSFMEINCLQSIEAVEITITINLGAGHRLEKRQPCLFDKNGKCMLLNTKQIDAYNQLNCTHIRLYASESLSAESEYIIQAKLIIPYTF